jgi:copper chaperone CopZ
MKTTIYLLFLLFIVGCQTPSQPRDENGTSQKKEIQTNKSITVSIEGMTCTGCEKAIENNIKAMEGVGRVKADHKKGIAQIEYDTTLVDASSFSSTIRSTGYEVVEDKQNPSR